jgi:hypothetical protein
MTSKSYLILLALATWLCSCNLWGGAADAFPSGKYSVTDFRVRDYKIDGTLAWLINGDQADASGRGVIVQGLSAELHTTDGLFLVISPFCRFDRLRQTGTSDEHVQVRGRTMTIDGTGFDLNLDKQRISIRSNVVCRFYTAESNLLNRQK